MQYIVLDDNSQEIDMKRVKPTRCYTIVYWTLWIAQHVSGITMPIIRRLRLYRWPQRMAPSAWLWQVAGLVHGCRFLERPVLWCYLVYNMRQLPPQRGWDYRLKVPLYRPAGLEDGRKLYIRIRTIDATKPRRERTYPYYLKAVGESSYEYFDVITSLVSIRWGACTEKSDVIVQPSSSSHCCARNMVT